MLRQINCTKFVFGLGSARDPAGELTTLPQASQSDGKGISPSTCPSPSTPTRLVLLYQTSFPRPWKPTQLSFDVLSPGNSCDEPHNTRNWSLWAIFLPMILSIYLHSNSPMYANAIRHVKAIQGHPRSLISVAIKIAYTTLHSDQ